MNRLCLLPLCVLLSMPSENMPKHAPKKTSKTVPSKTVPSKTAPPKKAPPKKSPKNPPGSYHLVWSDEFNHDGPPDPKNWTFENGFIRNHEQQWYQPENASCKHGLLIIEAQKEHKPNPNYQPNSNDWRKNRPYIDYTSACLETRGLHSWQTGRFEMRARIDIDPGCWPAWWTLGIDKPWPANGEIDMMEYYRGKLLANIACLGANHKARWYSRTKAVEKKWAKKFHVWRLDWNVDSIHLYVDNTLLNSMPLSALVNPDGSNPFAQPHFMLLNLAIGGDNGGDPSHTKFPRRFQVDYVRIYQPTAADPK